MKTFLSLQTTAVSAWQHELIVPHLAINWSLIVFCILVLSLRLGTELMFNKYLVELLIGENIEIRPLKEPELGKTASMSVHVCMHGCACVYECICALCACVYMCMGVHVYMSVPMQAVYVCMSGYMHACIYAWVYVHGYACMHGGVHVCMGVHESIHACVHVYIYLSVHVLPC